MAFCPNCGASVEGRFCAKCGTAVEAAGGAPAPPPASQPYGAGPAAGAQPYPSPAAAPAATAGGLSENVAGALCYILGLITGILFLVLAPYNQNRNVRFHAFQAIFFHVAWIVFWIANMVVGIVLPSALGLLLGLFSLLIALGGLVVWLLLMFKAYSGQRLKLPVIGDLAEKQA